MKRPLRWQLEKQRTAKGLRELPKCATEGCTGRAIGTLWGCAYCPRCQQLKQRAQRERRT